MLSPGMGGPETCNKCLPMRRAVELKKSDYAAKAVQTRGSSAETVGFARVRSEGVTVVQTRSKFLFFERARGRLEACFVVRGVAMSGFAACRSGGLAGRERTAIGEGAPAGFDDVHGAFVGESWSRAAPGRLDVLVLGDLGRMESAILAFLAARSFLAFP
jgi:hypothetical protein